MFVPKLVSTLKGYDRAQFGRDLAAGVIVGIVALPLAIAFAIASGVTPDRGLYTAIVAGFLISALGGSRVQIGGPTGAFVVIVYGIVQKYGVDGLTVATLMAGVLLVIMGFAKLGSAIKFIPHPVIIGFTSGIAVIIFSSQVKDLLGLQMGAVPAEFVAQVGRVRRPRVERDTRPRSSLRRLARHHPALAADQQRIPGAVRRTDRRDRRRARGFIFQSRRSAPVSADRSRRCRTRNSRICPSREVTALVGPAFTIAMLAAIESLLSAVVADGMIGGRHRSNMELVAQGIANIVSPLFGGIPATGAIARTATNIKNGGRTPVAGMTHALTLLLITLFFGRWAALIPLATLAAILVVVAYHMSEWRTFGASSARRRATSPCCSRRSASRCSSTSRSRSRSGWCSPRSSSCGAWRGDQRQHRLGGVEDDLSLDPAERVAARDSAAA